MRQAFVEARRYLWKEIKYCVWAYFMPVRAIAKEMKRMVDDATRHENEDHLSGPSRSATTKQ
jgi:hypothetical protein